MPTVLDVGADVDLWILLFCVDAKGFDGNRPVQVIRQFAISDVSFGFLDDFQKEIRENAMPFVMVWQGGLRSAA